MSAVPLPENESERLGSLRSLGILGTSREESFDRITSAACRALGVSAAAVSLVDEERVWFKSRVGFELDAAPREGAICAHAILGSEPLVVPDALGDERFSGSVFVSELGMRFYAAAPLVTSDGNRIGTLCVMDSRPRELGEDGVGVLRDLAAAVVELMELRRSGARLRDVQSELERVNERLRLMAMVAERTSNSVIIADREGRIEWVNEGFTRITGYTLDEVKGRKPGHVLQGPETDPETVRRIGEQLRRGEGFEADLVNYSKSGRQYWVRVEVRPVRDERGRIVNFMALESDITERKRMEGSLRRSEQHLRTLVETTPACVKVVSRDGSLLEMNSMGLGLIEASDFEEARGRCVFDLIAPEHREAFIAFHERVCDGQSGRLEFEIVGLRGGRRWVESYGAPLIDPETGEVRQVAVTHDISERKRSGAELAGARERFELMSRATRDVVWDYVVESGELWWNDNLLSAFGYPAGEGDRSFEWWSSLVHPDDRERTLAGIREAMSGAGRTWSAEYRFRRADGSYAHVLDRAYIIRDDRGRPARVVGAMVDLTQQKRAEEELRESEERLRRIASQVPGAVYQFRLAPDGTRSFPYISDGVKALCGVTTEELETDSTLIMASVLGEDVERVEASIVESARTMEPWREEFRIRHRDGSVRWISGSSVPQREPDGSVVWHGLIVDITERKEAENQLKRMTAILEATSDFVGMADVEGRAIYINAAGREMIGLDADEDVRGTDVLTYSPPWAAELIAGEAIPAAIRDGAWVGESAFVSRDGREIPVSQVVIAHKDADGAVEYLSTVARDMSDRKRVEEDLRRSRRFLLSTLDALCAHIAIVDETGRIIEVNRAWRRFAEENGLRDEHFAVGKNYLDTCESAAGPCADEAADVARGIRGVLSGEIDQFEVEYPCHGPGEQRWFIARATRFDTEGARYAVVAHENITTRKLAEEEVRGARDAAEEASRAKSEFLANMSHEIRTPMTAILGYADLLLDPSLSEDERRGHVGVIHRNGDHLLSVINDILDISKIESGKMTVERLPASPALVASEVVSMVRPRAIEKRLSLELEFATPVPEKIVTDPVRLRQILLNLVSNAVKFTEEGGVRLLVRYDGRGEPGDDRIVFEVVDTGIGLTEEQVSRLFRPFVQADASSTRRFGGTGLGLAISRRLAGLLGGDIDVSSVPGEGSSFVVRLPVRVEAGMKLVEPGVDMQRGAGSVAERPASLPRIPCRVLLAEDGPDNQRLLSFILRKNGAEVTVVSDGESARDAALAAAARGEPFDVVLMDMQMPVLDGYCATGQLRERGYKGLIFALTAHAMASDRDKCLAAGCDEYLSKPVSRRELICAIASRLGLAAGGSSPLAARGDAAA